MVHKEAKISLALGLIVPITFDIISLTTTYIMCRSLVFIIYGARQGIIVWHLTTFIY